MIDSHQASSALADIDSIARRVRQSRIYQVASLMLILWGPLTAIGYLAAYVWPSRAGMSWLVVDFVGVIGSFAVSAVSRRQTGVRSFDGRMFAVFVLFFGFGLLWSVGIVPFTPRQLSAFWPTYVMLAYSIVGLWFGQAFLAIGLGITALTLIGYYFSGGWFYPWMAAVNGGGLVLGGLWMRRS